MIKQNTKKSEPPWLNKAPLPQSFRSIFKWGDHDKFKNPNSGFFRVIADELGLSDADIEQPIRPGNKIVENTQDKKISAQDISVFESIVGPENINSDTYSRLKFATGKSMEDVLNLREERIENVSDIVLHPKTFENVEAIVKFCHEKKIPVHVYGGGSSVTQGLSCPKGGVTLVMNTHMNRVLEFNETNFTITVEAGMMGPAYEDILNRAPEVFKAQRRYTGGHFPQSFEHSSVGGWIVTMGSGQASSYYGDACDLVISQTWVTPTGTFKTHDYPATATGPKLNDIMKGSEGCFGVLVSLTMKIFPFTPETVRPFSFMFPGFKQALSAARQISQAGCGMPSVMRVSDPEETDIAMKMYGIANTWPDRFMKLKGLNPMFRCLMMGCTDGEKSFSDNLFKKIKKIGKSCQGLYLTGYPMKKWQSGRFSDPYMRDSLNDFGVLIDTLETAVTWEHIEELYQGVRSYVKSHPDVILLSHASHFYAQGTNLYFIFITKMMSVEKFKVFQHGIIENIIKNHGSPSHHHGVGRLFAPFMERHLGYKQMAVLRAVKKEFDPHNIMNPGGLGLC
jgi:alkyldihydroxyacetonephosphate synthase